MLMVGVTLTLGGVVVGAAVGSVGQANGSAYLGSSMMELRSEIQVGIVYAAVASSGSCPVFQGVNEGTSLTFSLFDYGTVPFTPADFVVNSTIYAGGYATLAPGTAGQYTLSLGACTHPSGLTILAIDAQGDEFQLGS
jgi:hypothetical protein